MKTCKPYKIGALGYAQQHIVDYLKEHGEATGIELYTLCSKQSKPLNQLVEKGLVFKSQKDKKYRLFVTEYDGMFGAFINEMALVFFKHHIVYLQEKGIVDMPCLMQFITPEMIEAHKELLPDYLEDLEALFIKGTFKKQTPTE